jgi:hypothetical protein
MTAVPAMIEGPVFAVPTGETTIDDATLLDGAATVWAVITYSADLPATPETKAALDAARGVFVERLARVGLCQDDLERYLAGFRSCEQQSGRGSPLRHEPTVAG